ncbi:dolichol-phosphate mannosyltransferase subunit 3 [Crepidotus variabilis]|uniref:Dolichol-phosphate mannosyltransferase subunit 3 n=1 Tax=Crepidotus variabilis TaxID=179855 RepID=A0A9P6JP51_9AGAR|nr:dolichol-phosphate mannosyltransferase subunit 3 [Crepidotus variabilis]
MARAHRVAATVTIVTIAYILTFFGVFSVPLVDEKVAAQILPVLPWWLLVSFGAYSLVSIGWGLLTLRECPEAYNELMSEIAEAKNDLRSKGVTVD